MPHQTHPPAAPAEPSREAAIQEGVAPWYLAYTKPQQEHIAAQNLLRQGYATYLPLYKHYKSSGGRSLASLGFVHEPMFPRYVFFRPGSARQGVSAARSTRGVSTLVSFGSGPAAIEQSLVDTIRGIEQEREQADLKAVSPFQPGARVRMRGQGMKGLVGLVLSVTNQRVTMLLDILGRQQLVDVDHAMLELG
ncbi:MAG: transcriptional activator RfaH [Hydrogenophaga sp.]|uniref:transcriptional activator RfaH n=1 Tax=Hydrogenophaga sp. TaxID=1904254 RepID=UPI0025BEBCEC|nr:transcriptional activator RfaH [Hydrogenophaga sp.]MBT9550662.1 transcriptional activator RfaH [Hydrogenophaga sp.]